MIDWLLLVLAHVLLRMTSPVRAFSMLRRVGSVFPELRSFQEVHGAAGHLTRGSCLVRSMAVAARSPFAEIVIGVQRPQGDGLRAHAWLEHGGRVIDSLGILAPAHDVIARLPDRATRGYRP